MILWKIVCGNNKCKQETSLIEDDDYKNINEICIDFSKKELVFICPHCKFENRITIGKSEQSRFPRIGGV